VVNRARAHHGISLAPRSWPTWLVLGALRIAAVLPLPLTRAAGAGVGLIIYAANAKRRRIARINLRLCFPELSERARRRLLRRHFARAGQGYVDVIFFAWASERRLARAVRLDGVEHLRAAVDSGRPVILLAPHCVGMNVGGIVVAKLFPVFSMIKLQRNPLANWLLNKARSRYGSPLVVRQQGLRPVVRELAQGRIFYYLPDEDFGPKSSVFVPFFGVPCATLTTLGRLARLADAVVIPCFTRLLPRSGYAVSLHPPLDRFPSADPSADAARMNRTIEHEIRLAPEQYMWTFKLFKTRPPGMPPLYG